MIIDSAIKDVEMQGDIEKYETSIDSKNLKLIVTLLSSNLYSFPERSFIREIVSNAWDAHVEANNTDTPVLIKLDYNTRQIIIRDFGTGISPERFRTVYCNIGSSTKRESNDFIGGFGIGKYSSLACSNTVYITSFYEGIAYHYIMIKGGNAITTNLVTKLPTEEKNGVEVCIKNINDLQPYANALKYISFFPNIYIEGGGYDINNSNIKYHEHYAATTISIKDKLLLGNVLYPCDKHVLSQESADFLRDIESTGIVIRFKVGEININPSREAILYTSETIKVIDERILMAKKELYNNILEHLDLNFKDIIEYYNAITKTLSFNPVTEEKCPSLSYTFSFELLKISKDPILYKGKDLSKCTNLIRDFKNRNVPDLKGWISLNGKLYANKIPYRYSEISSIVCDRWSGRSILRLDNFKRFSKYLKGYLEENYNNCLLVSDCSKESFKKKFYDSDLIKSNYYQQYVTAGIFDFLIDEFYQYINKQVTSIDAENDPSFVAYKEDMIANKEVIKDNSTYIVYIYNDFKDPLYTYPNKTKFTGINEIIKYIYKIKNGVILTTIPEADQSTIKLAQSRGFTLISSCIGTYKKLIKLDFPNIVPLNNLYTDKKVVNAKTLRNSIGLTSILKDGSFYKSLPYNKREIIDNLRNLPTISEKYDSCTLHSNIIIDEDLNNQCKIIQDLYKNYNKLYEYTNNPDIVFGLVLKQKLYRISMEAYTNFKNCYLIQLLCKK